MPMGRHNAHPKSPSLTGAGLRARYIQPERKIYIQNQAIDSNELATPKHKNNTSFHSGKRAGNDVRRAVNRNLKPAIPRQAKSSVLARHAIKRKPTKRAMSRRPNFRLSVLLVWLMVGLFGTTSVFGYINWRDGIRQQETVLARNIDEANYSNELSESEVTESVIAGFEVEADLPRTLTVPRLDINARVKRMVTHSDGDLSAPKNIYDVGWYDGSVIPGEEGTALLIGHVFGTTKSGVFGRIHNVQLGDGIRIERGDGQVIDYTVQEIEHISREEFTLEQALKPIEGSKSSLHLLTHSGRYDVRTNKYEKRILIRALQK